MPNNMVQVPCELWQKIADCLQVYSTLFPSCSTMISPLTAEQRRDMLNDVAVTTDEIVDAMFAIGV